MTATLPLCCSPKAFKLLASLRDSIESHDAMIAGAVAILMHQHEEADPSAVDEKLQSFADTIRARVRGSQPQAVLAHLHQFLFDEQGFGGNDDDYYEVANSYLPAVLETKRGLPITLSLIYKSVAERLGLRSWGVGLPGHFIVGIECDGNEMLVDPFSAGRILTPDEAHERVQEMLGPEVEWSDELLQPVSNRHWLTRILQNLLRNFGRAGHYADVAAILEMEMQLWPDQGHLQRDLALVLARIGLARPASEWLDAYLKNNPDDPQRTDLEQLLDVLTA